MSGIEKIRSYLRPLAKEREGIFIYLPKVSDFQKKEIKFHDRLCQDEEEVHQLNTLRNRYYHDYFKKWLYQLPQDSVILEIGAGSGHDLIPLLKKGYSIIALDISYHSVSFIKKRVSRQYPQLANQIIYLVADGQHLPLEDSSVEAIFMVASLHHFEKSKEILNEIQRVTKKDGLIIFAMEPSKFMMWFTKLFSKSERLRIHQSHSEADETHWGYNRSDLQRLVIGYGSLACLADARKPGQAGVIKMKRVWLTLGFLHYGFEAIFRIFKLKRRIKVPQLIEWLLLITDEILLKIPLINQLHWHWIIIIKNL